ncbi:hypothetical protein Btru_047590 [Bulinus truncatus]|nr:hypothetical protein Btru_047590 [Bulinus truncatus]
MNFFMNMAVKVFVVLMINCFMLRADAAYIQFRATPSAIHPILTTTFQLRCSIQQYQWPKQSPDTRVSVNPFLRYTFDYTDVTTAGTYWWQNPSPTTAADFYTTQDPYTPSTTAPVPINANVEHITSILITKVTSYGQREPVASVTLFDPPSADGYYASQAKVEGSCDRSPYVGEHGYLSITWDRPLEEQSGEYLCEVSGLSSDKHPVTLQSNLQVTFSQPTLSDLIGYISKNEMRITELEKENSLLKNEMQRWNGSSQTGNSSGHIKAQRIQTGSGECSYNQSHYVNFSQNYDTTPTIFLSITNLTMLYSYNTHEARVSAHDVNNWGFRLQCDIYDTTLAYEWMTIDNF